MVETKVDVEAKADSKVNDASVAKVDNIEINPLKRPTLNECMKKKAENIKKQNEVKQKKQELIDKLFSGEYELVKKDDK